MTIEDFCCAVYIHSDDTTYQEFLNSQHQASKSIGSVKKLRPNGEEISRIYGELYKRSSIQT